MRYFVVRDNSDPSKVVVIGKTGSPPKNHILETTKMVYEDQDCMKIIEGLDGMIAVVDPALVKLKLNRAEMTRAETKSGWNDSSILKRIKAGLFGGRI